jgi:hypothetical protein
MMEINDTTIIIKDMNGKDKKFDLADIFYIDENTLTEEYSRQAATHAYFTTALAAAEHRAAKLSMRLEQSYADADEYWRKEYDDMGKKYTEAVIKSLVIRDEEYGEIKVNYQDTQYEVDLLKAIVNSMRIRADMLVSLGAHIRQEYEMTGMSIRDREFDKVVDNVKSKIKGKKQ